MLEEFLATNVFHFILIFARVGMVFMALPGISAPYVSPRSRIAIALATCLILLPAVGPQLPVRPATAAELFFLVGTEVVIGGFYGAMIQALMATVHVAGTIIGFNSGMANAMVFDPISEQQGALMTGFLGNIAVLLVFALDLHHIMIGGVVESYSLIPAGAPMPIEDMVATITNLMVVSMTIGFQMASPFVAFALIFHTSMGLLNRLSPQMNVFFIGLPIQLLLSLALLLITMPAMMALFMRTLEAEILNFIRF